MQSVCATREERGSGRESWNEKAVGDKGRSGKGRSTLCVCVLEVAFLIRDDALCVAKGRKEKDVC